MLNNTLYLNNQRGYEAHWAKWSYNPKRAAQILSAHGCKKGGDGIYSCSGTRPTFQFESTRGNQLRELAFTIIQEQLRKNDIEVTNNFKPSSIAFGQDLVQGNYDLFMFAWLGSPDPAGSTPIWSCPSADGTQNYMSYYNKKVTKLLKQADATPKPAARAKLVNQADAPEAAELPRVHVRPARGDPA
jgi:peptide/nickel transport system substrate-binding protein